MADEAYFEKTVAAICKTRAETADELRRRGFTVLDSATNFLFARTPRCPGGALCAALRDRGVLIRHFDAPRIADWVRISIGTPAQMQRLFDEMDAVMGSHTKEVLQ